MPQSHWLHFCFHWEVKPKLSKLLAVVGGCWSLFWTHFDAVFHLSQTATSEPQKLEVQEEGFCYFFFISRASNFSFPHWESSLYTEDRSKIPIWILQHCGVSSRGTGLQVGLVSQTFSLRRRWTKWDADYDLIVRRENQYPSQGIDFQGTFVEVFPRQIDVSHQKPGLMCFRSELKCLFPSRLLIKSSPVSPNKREN